MRDKKLDNLSKNFTRAEAYWQVTSCPGWSKIKEEWLREVEQVGKMAVYPGFKDDVLKERLIEARLLLKRIKFVEQVASKKEHFENLLKEKGIATE